MTIKVQPLLLAIIIFVAIACGTSRNGVPTSRNPAIVSPPSQLVADGVKGSWSPDGTQLVFGHPRDKGIDILDVRTGERRFLTDAGKDPSWSPDGRNIVFVREPQFNQYGSEELWAIDPHGGMPRQIGTGGFPSWSADGRIVYVHSRENQVVAYAIDHPNDKPVILAKHTSSWYPAVSPDGSLIAYGAAGQLDIVDLHTEDVVWSWPMAGERGGLAAWSPDGRYLVVGGFDNSKLGAWILDVKLHRAVRLARSGFTMPDWTHNGDKLSLDMREGEHREIWLFSRQWIDARLTEKGTEFSLNHGVLPPPNKNQY